MLGVGSRVRSSSLAGSTRTSDASGRLVRTSPFYFRFSFLWQCKGTELVLRATVRTGHHRRGGNGCGQMDRKTNTPADFLLRDILWESGVALLKTQTDWSSLRQIRFFAEGELSITLTGNLIEMHDPRTCIFSGSMSWNDASEPGGTVGVGVLGLA